LSAIATKKKTAKIKKYTDVWTERPPAFLAGS
jgi:hypothetical protein